MFPQELSQMGSKIKKEKRIKEQGKAEENEKAKKKRVGREGKNELISMILFEKWFLQNLSQSLPEVKGKQLFK